MNPNTDTDNEIFYGSRGDDFVNCIRSLLKRAKIKNKYIDYILSEEGMDIYNKAFTSSSANSEENYEVFEQLGDLSANKFITWYMYKRFPQLNCPQGVKVVARLRINYGSKQTFWKIAESLGFWNFITATEEERKTKRKPLLEDTLESFIGATEYLLDTKIKIGVGYAIVYDILASIFNDIHISLQYNDLYDAKTRLKELFDFHKNLGTLKYTEEKNDLITTSFVFCGNTLIGQGSASLKADAQQVAAQRALTNLNSKGISKPIPEIYSLFSNNE
jgi:dsRNA-specific ribonuclease